MHKSVKIQYMLQILDNIPFKELTALNIGGPAKKVVTVVSEQELVGALSFAREVNLPFLIIGGGSNLLVSDSGVDALVIKNEMEGIKKEVKTLTVKSGTILQHLIDYANQNNLAGLQNLAGIPGTVGGAVYGNAGAYGQSISDCLREVTALDPDTGQTVTLSKEECEFSYRDSIFKKNRFIILEVKLKLEQGDGEKLKKESAETIKKRSIKYPPGIKCPGSFFKNLIATDLPKEVLGKIPKDKIVYGKIPAGTLLEMVGARGDNLNGIEIASYHANLFINKGGGKAQDFYTLAKKYADKVRLELGIELEPEVQLINLPPLF